MTTEKTLAKVETKQTPADLAVLEIMETLRRREARLELLLPPRADVARFKESVRFALAQQPSLVKCTPQSLVLAVMRGARTGLPVDGGGGLAWIVPYGNEATYVPGYKGLITLAKATGLVKDMQPIPVYKRDVFRYRPADDQPVEHEVYEPQTDDLADDRGPLRAVYCKTILPDGTKRYTVMYLKDIKIIQGKSRAKNGPWASDFVPMALKSVVKMDFKTLGVPPGDTYKALRIALAADTAADTGETDSELRSLEEATEPTANERLRQRLDVVGVHPPRMTEKPEQVAVFEGVEATADGRIVAQGEMSEADKRAAIEAEFRQEGEA
jgi:recombination protein RecT